MSGSTFSSLPTTDVLLADDYVIVSQEGFDKKIVASIFQTGGGAGGATGATGPQGTAGSAGSPGSPGAQGATGPTGPQLTQVDGGTPSSVYT
jgi:hypothetical protein